MSPVLVQHQHRLSLTRASPDVGPTKVKDRQGGSSRLGGTDSSCFEVTSSRGVQQLACEVVKGVKACRYRIDVSNRTRIDR